MFGKLQRNAISQLHNYESCNKWGGGLHGRSRRKRVSQLQSTVPSPARTRTRASLVHYICVVCCRFCINFDCARYDSERLLCIAHTPSSGAGSDHGWSAVHVWKHLIIQRRLQPVDRRVVECPPFENTRCQCPPWFCGRDILCQQLVDHRGQNDSIYLDQLSEREPHAPNRQCCRAARAPAGAGA
jgi:hypothetical protein